MSLATSTRAFRAVPISVRVVAATVSVGAPVAGALIAYDARYAAVVVGLIGAVALSRWPAVALLAFGSSAFTAGWFLEANRAGLLQVEPVLASVSLWAVLLGIIVVARRWWVSPHRLLVWAVCLYNAGVGFSLLVLMVREGNTGGLWEGSQLIAVSAASLLAMALVTRAGGRRAGYWIVVCFIVFESVYCVVQLSGLQFSVGPTGWFTVGNAQRWWDSRAIWGTFATDGNKAFGNAMVFCAAIPLAWALHSPGTTLRRLSWVMIVACTIMVLLSAARSAWLSLVVVCAVLFIPRLTTRRLVAALALLVVAGVVVTQTAAGDVNLQRGLFDQSTDARIQIWNTLVSNAPVDWVVGEGFGSAQAVTAQNGLSGVGIQGNAPPTENLYIRSVIEGGVIQLLSLLLMFALLLKVATSRAVDAFDRTWKAALLGITVALIVQSLTSDSLVFRNSAGVFWFLLGVVGGSVRVVSFLPNKRRVETRLSHLGLG